MANKEDTKQEQEVQQPKKRGPKPKVKLEPEAPVAEPSISDTTTDSKSNDEPVAENITTLVDMVDTSAEVVEDNAEESTSESSPPEDVLAKADNPAEPKVTADSKPVTLFLKKVKTLYRAPNTNTPLCSIHGLVNIVTGIPQNEFVQVSVVIPGQGRVTGWIRP